MFSVDVFSIECVLYRPDGVHADILFEVEVGGGHVVVLGVAVALYMPTYKHTYKDTYKDIYKNTCKAT